MISALSLMPYQEYLLETSLPSSRVMVSWYQYTDTQTPAEYFQIQISGSHYRMIELESQAGKMAQEVPISINLGDYDIHQL